MFDLAGLATEDEQTRGIARLARRLGDRLGGKLIQ